MTNINLFMIRHAPVVGKQGYIYGDDADIDLESCEERLKELANVLPNPEEAIWVSSGVDRAVRTAKAVLQKNGHENHQQEKDPAFREQNFGDLIGHRHEDVTDHLNFVDKKIYAPNPPGGESIEQVVSRVSSGINSLKEQAIQKKLGNIVIFTHGGTIRAANVGIRKLSIADFLMLDTPYLYSYEFCI